MDTSLLNLQMQQQGIREHIVASHPIKCDIPGTLLYFVVVANQPEHISRTFRQRYPQVLQYNNIVKVIENRNKVVIGLGYTD
jgi:hypothetical protein